MGAQIQYGANVLKVNANGMGQVAVYDAAGNVIGTEAAPFRVRESVGRATLGIYACSTFRILGTAATPQNIATIENPAASGLGLVLRRTSVVMDATAVLVSVAPSIKSSFPTAMPTGGTVIPACKFKSDYAAAAAVVRGGNASDGGGATAITATAGNTIWTQLETRMHTAAGFIDAPSLNALPNLVESEPFYILEGEALLIQGVVASAATTHFVVNFCWEEYTLP